MNFTMFTLLLALISLLVIKCNCDADADADAEPANGIDGSAGSNDIDGNDGSDDVHMRSGNCLPPCKNKRQGKGAARRGLRRNDRNRYHDVQQQAAQTDQKPAEQKSAQNTPVQKPQAETQVKNQGPSDISVQGYLGSNVEAKIYDPDMYNFRGGGPVAYPDELPTDFGSNNCWDNSKKREIDWQKATGAPEHKKIQQFFSTSEAPDDDYLIAFSKTKRNPTDAAKFESCSIACVSGDLEFSVKYWATTGINIYVCTREVFFDDDEPGNCQKLPIQKQPGPATLVMKNVKDLTAIIIKADNFVSDKGGMVIIDDIKVNYKPCPEPSTPSLLQTGGPLQTTVAPTTGDGPLTCQNVVCSFQHSLCSYKELQEHRRGSKTYTLQTGRYHNRLTGIQNGPVLGKKYLAAYLLRNDVAGIETGPLEFQEDRILQFYTYEATQNIHTKVCFDHDLKCPFIVGGDVQLNDRQWKLSSIRVPKETKKIFFISQNNGLNEGAVGITDVKLFVPDSPSSTTGTTNACPNVPEEGVLRDTNLGVRNGNPQSNANNAAVPLSAAKSGLPSRPRASRTK